MRELTCDLQTWASFTDISLGMGIAFVNMTDENEARLRDMLSTILRPSVIMGPGIDSSLPATDRWSDRC